jgi:hypothetical protein
VRRGLQSYAIGSFFIRVFQVKGFTKILHRIPGFRLFTYPRDRGGFIGAIGGDNDSRFQKGNPGNQVRINNGLFLLQP